jgi:hypothetical protein
MVETVDAMVRGRCDGPWARHAGRIATGIRMAGSMRAPSREVPMGRGILLWLLGVPIPVIILLALFWH